MRPLLVVAAFASAAHADDLAAIVEAAPSCDETRAHCFAIQLHVASDDSGLATSADWIASQLATANRHFATLDVGFELAGVDALPASAMHLETAADRNAIAAGRLTAKVIDVFITGQLDDIDIAGGVAYGVTWRRPKDSRKYLIVSAQAWERTLAHELGHFFGLPHSTDAISIMNKTARDDPPPEKRTFADDEYAAMRLTLKRLLRDRVIVDQRRRSLSPRS